MTVTPVEHPEAHRLSGEAPAKSIVTRLNWMAVILALAFVLRVANGLAQDPLAVYYPVSGGDSPWYLANGYTLITGGSLGTLNVDVSKLPSAPLYLVFVGVVQALFPWAGGSIIIRLLQAMMGTLTCYFAYRIGEAISHDRRVGMVAAAALAISPAFVMENAQILTETLYIFLVFGGMWVYLIGIELIQKGSNLTNSAISKRFQKPFIHLMIAGVLFGLATLTRAVLLLFPIGLAVHLLLVSGWRKGLQRAAILLVIYSLVVSTWTVVNRVKWGRWVIGGEGFFAFLYIGASDSGWKGPEAVDQNLAQDANLAGQLPSNPQAQQQLYQNTATQIISRDPPEWLTHRARSLASAILQPHGTIFFPGESLKAIATDWLRTDRSWEGLLRMTQSDAFWPKLMIYLFHYTGLAFGVIGMWLSRRSWRLTLPLVGFILYTLVVHFLLEAIPRYIFPATLVGWIFAAITLVQLWERVSGAQGKRFSLKKA